MHSLDWIIGKINFVNIFICIIVEGGNNGKWQMWQCGKKQHGAIMVTQFCIKVMRQMKWVFVQSLCQLFSSYSRWINSMNIQEIWLMWLIMCMTFTMSIVWQLDEMDDFVSVLFAWIYGFICMDRDTDFWINCFLC